MTRSLVAALIGLTLISSSLVAQEPDRPRDRPRDSDRPRTSDRPENADRPRIAPPGEGRPGFMTALPVMAALDANRDGELSADEIGNATAALQKLDRNGDGKLTRDELMPTRGPGGDRPAPATGDRPGAGGGPEQFLARLMQADANGDGKLSKDEVPERMQRLFETADANGDGSLDKEELKRVVQRMSERGAPGDRPARPEGARPDRPRDGDR